MVEWVKTRVYVGLFVIRGRVTCNETLHLIQPANIYINVRYRMCVRAQYTINGVLFAAVAVWFVRAILPAKFSTSVNLSGLSMLAPATGIHTIRCKYNDGSVTMKASTRFFRTNTA